MVLVTNKSAASLNTAMRRMYTIKGVRPASVGSIKWSIPAAPNLKQKLLTSIQRLKKVEITKALLPQRRRSLCWDPDLTGLARELNSTIAVYMDCWQLKNA